MNEMNVNPIKLVTHVLFQLTRSEFVKFYSRLNVVSVDYFHATQIYIGLFSR